MNCKNFTDTHICFSPDIRKHDTNGYSLTEFINMQGFIRIYILLDFNKPVELVCTWCKYHQFGILSVTVLTNLNEHDVSCA
jgi:hypothetical protein